MKSKSIEIDLFDFIIIVLTKESPHDEMTVAYKTGIGPYKVSSLVILSSEIDLYMIMFRFFDKSLVHNHIYVIYFYIKGASMLCNEVMSLLEQNKLNQNRLGTEVVETQNPLVIGLYYDDPESVPEDELRYAVGAVLSRGKVCLTIGGP